MSAKVQKGMGGGALSCQLYRYTNFVIQFNSLSKRFEYLKCKASELISKQYRIS